jgi:anti-sigma B factor antagonist
MQPARLEPSALSGPEVMELEGRLDSGTAPLVSEDVLLCIQSGARHMILDCSNLTYMTAAGLRAIMALSQEMKSYSGDFAVCGLQPQVEALFTACGIQNFISVFGEQSDAVAALS